MILLTAIMQIIGKGTHTPSGWISFNCPACTHRGEPSPDKLKRGGIKSNPNGSFSFHCFRCNMKCHWEPGKSVDENVKLFLSYLGLSEEKIRELSFLVWKENLLAEKNIKVQTKSNFNVHEFSKKELPNNSRKIIDLIKEGNTNEYFLKAAKYLYFERGDIIANNYDFYWSSDIEYREGIIIPAIYKNEIVGNIIRSTKPSKKVRYINNLPKNFIFNNQIFEDESRKYIVLVEGIFDAIAIDGVSCLGNGLSEGQLSWLKKIDKEIILVPDRDLPGRNLIKYALENNWYVSIPHDERAHIPNNDGSPVFYWGRKIKDCDEAVKKYGRLYTIQSILSNKTKNYLDIKFRMEKYIK